MKLLDPGHAFFRPLWRRAAIVAACLGWALFELSLGETLWALAFGAVGAYCGWVLILAYKPPEEEHDGNG